MSESIVNDLAEVISDSLHGGDPHSAARDVISDFVVLPMSELPVVIRIDPKTISVDGIRYSSLTTGTMMNTVRRLLASVRFLEVEAEQKAEAERIAVEALLTEAYTLWAAGYPEPMAQWEFELLVTGEELEKWLAIAQAARSLHAK